MVNKSISIRDISAPEKSQFPNSPLAETRANSSRACNKTLMEALIRSRLSDLFSSPDPAYALNGGAALHFVFLGKRVPNDIDLRCDNLEETRKAFAGRFEQFQRTTTVPVYCFRDENGIIIDITQNRFARTKKNFMASQEISGFLSKPFPVVSYDFEVLLAEKLIAMARKGNPTDVFDAYSCLLREMDARKVAAQLKEIGEQDGISPAALLSPTYSLDWKISAGFPDIGLSIDAMLENVRAFVRSIL